MPCSPDVEPRRGPRRPPPSPRRSSVPLLGAALLAALGGCGGGPPPRLHLLEPAPATAPSPAPVAALDALGVGVVSLPGYTREARIASRGGGSGLDLDDDDRWAEAPEKALTRTFAESLRRGAGATVLVEPWPRGFVPDARVELAFDRLLRTADGGAEAGGRILLLSSDGRELLGVRPFDLAEAGASTAPAAYFAALARLVDRIARLALEALGGEPPAS